MWTFNNLKLLYWSHVLSVQWNLFSTRRWGAAGHHSAAPGDQLQILASTSVKGMDWRQTWCTCFWWWEKPEHPEETHTKRACRRLAPGPAPAWNRTHDHCEATVLTTTPPCCPTINVPKPLFIWIQTQSQTTSHMLLTKCDVIFLKWMFCKRTEMLK